MRLILGALALVCAAWAQKESAAYDQYLYRDDYFRENCHDTYQPYNMSRLLIRDFDVWRENMLTTRSNSNPKIDTYLKEIWELAFGKQPVEPVGIRTAIGARFSARQKRSTPRERKEYRSMTAAERTDYHEACRLMKIDLLGGTPKYDLWVQIHRIPMGAHGGPGFLPWHRVFLYLFETALRQYKPNVVLPYLDSSIDRYLANPMSSILWTPAYMGTANGDVQSGPFDGWVAENGQALRREVTFNINQLYSNTGINFLQSRANFLNYYPQAEQDHNGVHGYVGGANGHMSNIGQANDDPIFWTHHAFVDCLWEFWRQDVQIPSGINPLTDYPGHGGPHSLNAIMNPFFVTNQWGLGRQFEKLYHCAPRVPPQGSDDCCCAGSQPNGQYRTYSYSPEYPPPLPQDYKGRTYSDRVYTRVRVQYEGYNPYRDPNYRPYDPYRPHAPVYEAPTSSDCCDTQDQYVMADCQGADDYSQYSRGYTSMPTRYAVNEGYVYFAISYREGRGRCYLNVYTPGGGQACRPHCYDRRSNSYRPCCGVFNIGRGYTAPVYRTYSEAMSSGSLYGSRPNDDIVYYCPNPRQQQYRG